MRPGRRGGSAAGRSGPNSRASVSSGRLSRSGATPSSSASVVARALCASSAGRGSRDGGAHAWLVGRRDVARPGGDDPARLQLEQREVGALGEELADDAEAGQVRMQRALVEGEVGAEHGPYVVVQVWDVDVVAGCAHDRVDGLDRAVDEGDGAAVDRSDRRTADDAAVRDLREVVLTQRKSRREDVAVRLGRSERGGVAGDAQDPVAERAAELLAREQAPLERPERRVPLPVRRHAVDDLLDHVAGLAEGRDDGRDGREIGCDLETADPVAVDERAAIAVRPGARIVEGVDYVAVERVEPGREARLAEAARCHDHAVEALTVDRPSRGRPG